MSSSARLGIRGMPSRAHISSNAEKIALGSAPQIVQPTSSSTGVERLASLGVRNRVAFAVGNHLLGGGWSGFRRQVKGFHGVRDGLP